MKDNKPPRFPANKKGPKKNTETEREEKIRERGEGWGLCSQCACLVGKKLRKSFPRSFFHYVIIFLSAIVSKAVLPLN